MNSVKKNAKIAGLLYFIYFATHVISDVSRDSYIVHGDAAKTISNIMVHEKLFTVTAMGDLLAAAFFALAAWALYVLLKPVNKNLALLFLLMNLTGVAIQCSTDIFLFARQLLLSDADYLKAFQYDQLQSLAMFFLDLREKGFIIAQLFFSIWLLPLGYLVYKSGFLPRILGVVMMIHFVGWLITFFQSSLFPDFGVIIYVTGALGFISEIGLTLWLLIKGVKDQKPAVVDAG
jgi:hypothetical protein